VISVNVDDIIKKQSELIKKHHDKFKNLKFKNEKKHQRINEELTKKQIHFYEKKKARKSAFDFIRNK